MKITRNGIETTAGPSEWFTGAVFVDTVAAPSDGSHLSASSNHYTPCARTAWHTHPTGQTICDAEIVEPTDAVITATHACICGSDLWPYKSMEASEVGRPIGHEAVGVVEAVGADVRTMKIGDLVVMPFAYSDGSCVFCHEG